MNLSIICQLKLKKPSDLSGTIIIRAFLNRRPVASKSTGQRILKTDWDHASRQVIANAANARLINMLLKMELQKIDTFILQKRLLGATINRQLIIEAVQGYDTGQNFYDFCRKSITQYNNHGTRRHLTSQLKKLECYKPALSFADIDYWFLVNWKKYMQEELHNKPNSVWSSLKFLNTMLNRAIRTKGIITENPFKEFDRGTYQQGQRNYLHIAECEKIQELVHNQTADYTTRAVAARFLLMAYSGMRFTDAMNFNPGIHVINNRLVMKYSKFDTQVNYQLHSRLQAIIELIPQFPLKISLTHFNIYLKLIAGLCKINTHISSHTGRHTMGYLLSELNIPREKAQKILGHKDQRSTNIYYHITDEQVDRELSKFNEISCPAVDTAGRNQN